RPGDPARRRTQSDRGRVAHHRNEDAPFGCYHQVTVSGDGAAGAERAAHGEEEPTQGLDRIISLVPDERNIELAALGRVAGGELVGASRGVVEWTEVDLHAVAGEGVDVEEESRCEPAAHAGPGAHLAEVKAGIEHVAEARGETKIEARSAHTGM